MANGEYGGASGIELQHVGVLAAYLHRKHAVVPTVASGLDASEQGHPARLLRHDPDQRCRNATMGARLKLYIRSTNRYATTAWPAS